MIDTRRYIYSPGIDLCFVDYRLLLFSDTITGYKHRLGLIVILYILRMVRKARECNDLMCNSSSYSNSVLYYSKRLEKANICL